MKATRKTQCLLAGAVMLLVAGLAGVSCTKGSLRLLRGGSVRFTVSTGTAGTRTAYSGEGTVSDGFLVRERIDWTDGDLIRVFSPQAAQQDATTHYADYEVQSHETIDATGAKLTSRATVAVAAGSSSLLWESSESGDLMHDFFAVYPSPTTPGFTAGHTLEQDGMVFAPETMGEDEIMTFTGVIPVAQTVTRKNATENVWLPDMRPAYMLATASSTQADAEDGIALQFLPKFSAFEFELSCGENPSITLTSFTLTCTTGYLTGAYKISQENFGLTTVGIADANVTGGGKTITVDFGAEGISVVRGKPFSFAVIALPQQVGGLTISFTTQEMGTRSLALKKADDSDITFGPYGKHRIYGLSLPALLGIDAILYDPIIWDGKYTTTAYSDDDLVWTGLSTDLDAAELASGDNLNWAAPNNVFDGNVGDQVNWMSAPAISGPYAGLYLTRGYLTKTAAGFAMSGDDQMEIIKYYDNEDVNAVPRHYMTFGEVPASGIGGFTVPTTAQWGAILGLSSPARAGATVNGVSGHHFAKVTVDVVSTPYAAYSPTGNDKVTGLLLFPDGADIHFSELTVFDTPDDGFTNLIDYADLLKVCRGPYACVFLPCAGKYAGSGWTGAGTNGWYGSAVSSQGLSFNGGVFPGGSLSVGDYFPVRLVRE